MNKKSVLAPVFVPKHRRDVNLRSAVLLPTCLRPTDQHDVYGPLRASLVPYPETYDDLSRCCPVRIIGRSEYEADLYYAIRMMQQEPAVNKSPPPMAPTARAAVGTLSTSMRTATTTTVSDSASSGSRQPANGTNHQEAAAAARSVSSSSARAASSSLSTSVTEYCAAWARLLREERLCLLRLYERYSKYYVMVIQQTSAPRPVAAVEIAGIADFTPAIGPGDLVLVRSVDALALPPSMTGHVIPDAVDGTSTVVPGRPAVQHVELRCKVESVGRQQHEAGPPASGKVFFSWTYASMHMYLLTNAIDLASSQKKKKKHYKPVLYNLRFIPSWEPLVGCMSALDWLSSLPEHHSRAFLHSLLFPTSAPALPSEHHSWWLMEALEEKKNTDQHDEGSRSRTTNGSSGIGYGNLNLQQRDFCRLVTRRTLHPTHEEVREPLILTGPAGTGKTQTMLHVVKRLLQSGTAGRDGPYRILICTPSHTAADVITRRLRTDCSSLLTPSTMFRLYSSSRPLATVPVDLLPYTRQDPATGTFCLPPDARSLLSFRLIVCTCRDAHLLYRVGLTNAQLRIRRQTLEQKWQELCRETNLVVSLRGVTDPHWSHLFIDEAAQATEPETLIPLSVVVDPEPGTRKVEICLVGDPRQLSPEVYGDRTVLNNDDVPTDLSRSWMERLLLRPVSALGGGQSHLLGPNPMEMKDWIEYSCRENLSVFLTMNYRGHPSFLMMPSALFYFDKLQSGYVPHPTISSWCPTLRMVESLSNPVSTPHAGEPNRADDDEPAEVQVKKRYDWPIHFRGVIGQDKSITISEGYTSQSWTNEQEAMVVAQIIQTLIEEGVPVQSIGVMAPFRGQVVRIRKILRDRNLSAINVGTIEDYQSVERDVIVLSLTRATPAFVPQDVASRVGVFGQPKRSNVALTRAEHLFIVVGNPGVMEQDPIWRQFLLFSFRNGLFYGDPGDTVPKLRWKPGTSRLVKCRPESRAGEARGEANLVVVSTLERSSRHGS